MCPTVAVVEDDRELGRMLDRGLRAVGFDVVLTSRGGELLAAAKESAPDGFVIDGGLRLDPLSHAAAAGGAEVPLTPTEYRLLAALVARPGEVVRRAELVAAGWPDGAIVHDNTLDAYVARLRRKLREIGREGAIA